MLLLVMLVISYFLLPKKVFYGWYNILAILFIILFAITTTYLIRSIKDKVILQRKVKRSIFGIIFSLIGLFAFQVCGIEAPVCGISVGTAIISTIFPSFAFQFLNKYTLYFIYISIVFQLAALFQMKCFAEIINKKYLSSSL